MFSWSGYQLFRKIIQWNCIQSSQKFTNFTWKKKVNKVENVISSREEKEKYVMHVSVLKQALNHGWVLRKVQRVIKFDQEDWLKPYIDMNTKLRKEAKNDFEKDFFKLMNNCFWKSNGKSEKA